MLMTVLLSSSEEAIREMMKKLKRIIKKKLTLNVNETKIMEFGETRRSKKKIPKQFMWKGEPMGREESYNYLGYILSENNNNK